jgi:hypothetical protein
VEEIQLAVEAAVGGTYAIEIRLRNDLKAVLDARDVTWDGQVVFADLRDYRSRR